MRDVIDQAYRGSAVVELFLQSPSAPLLFPAKAWGENVKLSAIIVSIMIRL